MSDVAYLTISAEQVETVIATVLGLYGARAEALAASAQGFLEGTEELVELEHARAELRAVEDVLSDIGWPEPVRGAPVELVAQPRLLREIARASLLDAADAVVETISRYEACAAELPAVRRAVEAVPALFGLFVTFESGYAPDEEE